MNKALKLSCIKGLPVRVVRSFKASLWATGLARGNLSNQSPFGARHALPVPLHTRSSTSLVLHFCTRKQPAPPPSAGEAVKLRTHSGHAGAVRRRVPHPPLLAQARQPEAPHLQVCVHVWPSSGGAETGPWPRYDLLGVRQQG